MRSMMKTRAFLLLLLLFSVMSAGVAADKPNFVWILSEDNSKHFLRLFDPSGAPTPRIEAMAREGLVFNHAFSNSPVCSVARTTLITSCYAPRIGTQFHRRAKMASMPEGLKMFPAYLREAGYYTTNNSKTDYNAVPGKDVWDESSGKAHWSKRPEKGQPFFHQQTYGVSHESSLHFTAEQMRTQKTVTDPATVGLAPYHPDTATFRYTYARYHDRIRDVDALVGGMLDELKEAGVLEDTFVFYFGDHGGVLPRGKGYAYESGIHIPLVVRVPEKWQHLVPHARGEQVDGFVSFVDFGPTLLQLAGVEVPAGVDGKPFLGEGVTAEVLASRDEAFGYADRFDEKIDFVRTLRKGPYKYMRNYWPQTFDGLQNDYRYRMLAYQEWRELYKAGKLNPVQSQFFRPREAEALYDLRTDPHETMNLAARPEHAATLAEMRGRLNALVVGLPDLSFFPESHLVEKAMDNPVAFGQAHREEIAKLVEIADLQLLRFEEAEAGLVEAVGSDDPWQRFWGYIGVTSFGPASSRFGPGANLAALTDPEVETRMRAVEFLGLTMLGKPAPGLMSALKDSRSAVATNAILNTAVLLKDGQPGYTFTISEGDVNHTDRYISDRLNYLAGKAPRPWGGARKRRK